MARRRRARAFACCAIVVRSSRPPSLWPLTTLAPHRPRSPRARAAGWPHAGRPRRPVQWHRRGQGLLRERPGAPDSRALRGHSEGTQRPLSGTQRPSEALSGHSEGTQRALRGHAEAIRGDPRALRGTQRPSKGTQRPPLAIIRNQEHSAALSGTPEGTGTQDGHKGHIAC